MRQLKKRSGLKIRLVITTGNLKKIVMNSGPLTRVSILNKGITILKLVAKYVFTRVSSFIGGGGVFLSLNALEVGGNIS